MNNNWLSFLFCTRGRARTGTPLKGKGRPGSNRHAFKGQGILSPSCLPIPPLRHLHKKSRLPSGPCGAENETRTRDPDLGKVVLYQLSYFRLLSAVGVFVRDSAKSNALLLLSLLRKLRFALERKTRLELATPTLARSCSTN